MPQVQRPSQVPQYALASLQALADRGLGQAISMGGAFGLPHYHTFLEEFLNAAKS